MLKKKRISDARRLEILGIYLGGNASKMSIEKKYGLSHGSIRYWLGIFDPKDKPTFDEMKKKLSDLSCGSPCGSDEELRSLQLRIKELESALRDSQMARDAYNLLIDLAEDKYHIKIRKNSGAK